MLLSLAACGVLASLAAPQFSGEHSHATTSLSRHQLPDGPLIISYMYSCDGTADQAKVLRAAADGVNVVVWFAVDLGRNATTGAAQIGHDDAQTKITNFSCVVETAAQLREAQLQTTHMLSIGGWNAPHPDTAFTGEHWWSTFKSFNAQNEQVFDGIDWDLEGNDAPSSAWNAFTPACMRLVGEMSLAAKRDGFLVSMVPPESYLDPWAGGAFDLSLTHAHEDHPSFTYHGQNTYAHFLDAYGTTPDGEPTFDLVVVQLYESWSRAAAAVEGAHGQDPATYLALTWVPAYFAGWPVNFSAVPALARPDGTVRVRPSALVLGFSYGWADGKGLYVPPQVVGTAWAMMPESARPRGVMYWNINELTPDGPVNGTNVRVNFAAGFNDFLHVRAGAV